MADVEHTVSLRLGRGKAQLDHFNGRDNQDYVVARAVFERGSGPCGCDEVRAIFDARECSLHLAATLAPCSDAKTMLVVDVWAWFTAPQTADDHAITMPELRAALNGSSSSSSSSSAPMCRRATEALTHMLRVEMGAFWSLELYDGSPWHRSAIDMWLQQQQQQQQQSHPKGTVEHVLSECTSREAQEVRKASVLEFDFFS